VEACRQLTATRWVFRHASQLARFWQVALGWRIRPYDQAEVTRLAAQGLTPESDPMVAIDSPDGSLVFFLQQVPEPKTVKNRMHVDARLRDEAHLEELLRLGATVESAQDGWAGPGRSRRQRVLRHANQYRQPRLRDAHPLTAR
jgi:hypothetical protein